MVWTLSSWAPDEPRAAAGQCTGQRSVDGRWVSAPCTEVRPDACLDGKSWTVTGTVSFASAPAACVAIGSMFELPQAGDQNADLHAVAGPVGGA